MQNNSWEDPNHANRKTRLRSIGEGRALAKLQRRESERTTKAADSFRWRSRLGHREDHCVAALILLSTETFQWDECKYVHPARPGLSNNIIYGTVPVGWIVDVCIWPQ
jgi:hypothetical protein